MLKKKGACGWSEFFGSGVEIILGWKSFSPYLVDIGEYGTFGFAPCG